MKKVIIEDNNTIPLSQINLNIPIFIKDRGKLIGMVTDQSDGWIVLIGGGHYLTKNWTSRDEMIKALMRESDLYEFFIESDDKLLKLKKCNIMECKLNDQSKQSGCKEFTYVDSCHAFIQWVEGEKL